MRRLAIPLILVLAVAATGSAALAGGADVPDADGNVHYAWANVTRVNPIYQTVQVATPHQQCYQQPVVRQTGGSHTAATVLGAVVGGVLGSTVGKGDGRKAATVAGAVVGGAVGNGVARRGDGTATDSVTHCDQVQDVTPERRIVGYTVEYRYRGYAYTSRLDYDPGTRLRVRITVTPAD